MGIKANTDILALDGVHWLGVPASGGDESLSGGSCFQMAVPEEISPAKHFFLGEMLEFDDICASIDGTARLVHNFILVEDFGD